MWTTVIVSKTEFNEKPAVHYELIKLSRGIEERAGEYLYITGPGKLLEFLHCLRDNEITYNTQFNPSEDDS